MTPKALPAAVVFADGACSGNPGPGGWGAIVVTPDAKVIELGGRAPATTNNRMELAAVTHALEALKATPGPVEIYTDSVYVIRGITQWIWGWRKRGWKTAEGADVSNVANWKALFAQVMTRKELGPIEWRFVRGHSGIPGNERVDTIAVAFAQGRRPSLYSGPLLKYDIPVLDLPEKLEPLPEMKGLRDPKPSAHSYLSLVNGVAQRHATWKECEARVKGRSGAKFKKSASEADERAILAQWGARLS